MLGIIDPSDERIIRDYHRALERPRYGGGPRYTLPGEDIPRPVSRVMFRDPAMSAEEADAEISEAMLAGIMAGAI